MRQSPARHWSGPVIAGVPDVDPVLDVEDDDDLDDDDDDLDDEDDDEDD